jgi:uncharacterized RDD family membrane protein YckC
MNTQGARNLIVDSATGVDLALPVAGPGARCYAFLIDWHIRMILFTAWYATAALVYNGRWSFVAPLNPDAKWFVFVVAPAATTYFLYHIVLEIAMHGRTPGKRIAGVHIVTRDGGPPDVGALLARNVFRLVDTLPLLYGVGLVATFVTKDHVRVGDMAAGTLLVYARTDIVLPEPTINVSRERDLSASDAEVINELLLRWPSLHVNARRRLAIAILSRCGINAAPETQTDVSLRAQLESIVQNRPT